MHHFAATIAQILDAVGIIAGDLDLNGQVEFADFLKLADSFGDSTKGGIYANGDLDLNGEIEFADFLQLSGNFGQEAGGASAVPEPASLPLLAFGLIIITACTKTRERVVG